MQALTKGSFQLFRVANITVYLHWSWFLVACIEVVNRANHYSTAAWNLLEYLALFGIVLLHEFGHALACRQVGGKADKIVLWPLGGVAYVAPPPRPGAQVWSIAAGPLVNVLLVPITGILYLAAKEAGWQQLHPDAFRFLFILGLLNGFLLVFNLLPIYPLDGGQILQALLWIWLSRGRSLRVVSFIGLGCGIALIGLILGMRRLEIDGLRTGDFWLIVTALFIAWRSVIGFRVADALSRPGMEFVLQGQENLKNGAFAQAITDCTKAIELLRDNDETLAAVHLNRAVGFLHQGELDRAIADCADALRLNPHLAPAYSIRALAYLKKGDWGKAKADISAALRLNPKLGLIPGFVNLGQSKPPTSPASRVIQNLE
jgi:Zn-dependent protease